jgi:hypothetical protein
MANEITHALLQTNGGQVPSVMADMLIAQLFDPTDLRQYATFHDLDGVTGSDTVDITQDAVPQAAAAASSETVGGQSNTAYTTSEFSLTWARYVLQYQLTDLLAINGGPVQMQQVINSLNTTIGLTLTDLLAALFSGLSNTVNPSAGATTDLDVDTIYAAQYQLNNSVVPGSFACVLYPEQFNNFQASLRGEPGAVQFVPATADMLRLSGPGYKGSWNGIEFVQSDSVAASAGSSVGAMFGTGCFGWTMRDWRRIQGNMMISPDDVLADFGVAFVERNRDATNAMTSAILNMYPAVVEQEDARGVGILSDR